MSSFLVKLATFTLVVVVIAAAFACTRRDGHFRRPNFVVVVTDDQHPAAIEMMSTVLTEIVGRGVRFTNAFASTPLCAPSRASILTGQYPRTHGVISNGLWNEDGTVENGVKAFDDSSTLATWLDDAGYRTALLGKYINQYDKISPYVPPGWDEWYAFVEDTDLFFDYTLNENGQNVRYGASEDDYSTDVLARHAVDFIRRNKDEPFFLFLAPFAPHRPSQPAPRHDGHLAELPLWRPPSWNEAFDDQSKPPWLRVLTKDFSEEGLAAQTRERTRQLESLLSVDEAIAAILAVLAEHDLDKDTVVIFTADHGLSWGEHRWTGKQVAYEESIRVPLGIRYPARWQGPGDVEEMVLNVDLAPTIAQLAGVAPDMTPEGRSFVDLVLGAEMPWRQSIVVEHFRGGFLVPPWSAIRTQRHKYIRTGRFQELYDLELDPYELDSRAGDPAYAETLRDLAQLLDESLEQQRR